MNAFFRTEILPLIGDDPAPAIAWLKQNSLLKAALDCPACSQPMNWTRYAKTKDQFTWKCQNSECHRYKATVSIRSGSWFYNSNTALPKWIHVMYLWAIEESEKNASRQTDVSQHSMVSMYALCREICDTHLQHNPISLGGPDVIVEIDESCFSHKPKHHITHQPLWVFGAVDTSRNPSVGFMEIVERRDAQTLLPIIANVVRPGSVIHSDEWRAYRGIQGLGFNHRTVNHSVNFVEANGVHTQHIESY